MDLYKSNTTTSKAVTEHNGDALEGRQRQMEVSFNLWSTLGLVYSITATPVSIGSYLTFSLVLGGAPFFIYGYIFAVCFNIILCVALAEVASIYPHPSGHIYWVGRLAPKSWAALLSYSTGILTSAAWFFWNAGTYLLTSQILLAMVMVLYPNRYTTYPAWHVVLLAFAEGLLAILLNIPFFKTLPSMFKCMVVLTNTGILFLAVSLLVRAEPKQTAHSVFVEVVNQSGWPSVGVVFFLGLLPGTTAINGFDSASHLVEEMSDPARQVPQVMIGNALLSGSLGLPMAIIFCFCITHSENLLAPVGGVTIVQLFHDALRSKALFTIASLLYVLVTLAGGVAVTTTVGRVWWSFSTHRGLPFHSWLAKIHKTKYWAVPTNAICASAFFSCLVLLVQLGPSFVLAGIFSTANICFYLSYAITLACFLQKKWTQGLPPHYLDLKGVLGDVLGVVSIIWCLFASVWLMVPYYLPVTPQLMNWSVAILGVVIVLSSVDWFVRARKSYIIPSLLIL
ncbi:hypothetical protein LTR51_008770 [Lithohypha guttulata]|nr:hypothetical protein LTR51_008770 [Lithohypha guttulata]